MKKQRILTALFGTGLAALGYQVVMTHTDTDVALNEKAPLYAGSNEVARVVDLQKNLTDIGFNLGQCGTNGLFTIDVEKAVSWFQANNGLKGDGIADSKTERAIASAAQIKREQTSDFALPSYHISSVFMQNVQGYQHPKEIDALRNWQAKLVQLNYNLSPCYTSGQYDDVTKNAVKAFQKDHDIYPASGILDKKTQASIQANIDGKENIISANDLMASFTGKARSDNPAVQKIAQEARMAHLESVTQHYMTRKKGKVSEYFARDIQNAAFKTGWDISYLFAISAQESSNRAWAKAACDNCTATGPFQFIKQTWLGVLKKYGAKYGYKDLVASITKKGKYYVVPEGEKGQYILDLRKDTKLSSLMAAEFAQSNYDSLVKKLGNTVGRAEVYMAHFFGASQAVKFIKAYQASPNNIAAKDFPKEAASNKHVFYEGGDTAKPRTHKEVHNFFKRKISPEGKNILEIYSDASGIKKNLIAQEQTRPRAISV